MSENDKDFRMIDYIYLVVSGLQCGGRGLNPSTGELLLCSLTLPSPLASESCRI